MKAFIVFDETNTPRLHFAESQRDVIDWYGLQQGSDEDWCPQTIVRLDVPPELDVTHLGATLTTDCDFVEDDANEEAEVDIERVFH